MLQIGKKNLYVVNNNIGVSYNTPVSFYDPVQKTIFITNNYYSNTTSHHKTYLIRFFEAKNIIYVNHEVLIDLINNTISSYDVINDYLTFYNIAIDIKSNNINSNNILDGLNKGLIKTIDIKHISYKNKNFKNIYYKVLKTEYFKVTFKVVSHAFLHKVKRGTNCYNYYQYKYKYVITGGI